MEKVLRPVVAMMLLGVAGWTNGVAIYHAATHVGWDKFSAVLLPLSIDGLGVMAAYMWRRGNNPGSRRLGKWTTFLALAVSAVVAGYGHWTQSKTGSVTADLLWVLFIGVIPAFAVIAFVELLVRDADVQVGRKRERKPRQSADDTPGKTATQAPADPPAAPKPTQVEPAKTESEQPSKPQTTEEDAKRVESIIRQYGVVSRPRLIELLRERDGVGMSTNKAAALLREYKASQNGHNA